jgi:hypothetical protein
MQVISSNAIFSDSGVSLLLKIEMYKEITGAGFKHDGTVVLRIWGSGGVEGHHTLVSAILPGLAGEMVSAGSMECRGLNSHSISAGIGAKIVKPA